MDNEAALRELIAEQRERIAILEQDKRSVHHRLDNLEKLTESVHIIATETKAMREDVNDITERVDEIEKRPMKQYDQIKTVITTAIITAVISGLVGIAIGYLSNTGGM